MGALVGQLAAARQRGVKAHHGVPDLGNAFLAQRAAREHRHRPVGRGRPQQVQGHLELALGQRGGLRVDVGLVDDDQVGQLDHAFLERLQLVAGVGQLQQQEAIDHAGDGGFRLADADGLHDHHVIAGRLAQQQALAGAAGDAAQVPAGRGGPDEGGWLARQQLHARLVAQNRAASALAGRVHRQHGEAMAAAGQVQAERLDEGRFADARHAADAQAHRLAGVRRERRQQGLGDRAVLRTGRFDQRDGRATEFLLGCAIALRGEPGVHVLAADTDGIDGVEDNAGAIVTPNTLARARALGLDAQEHLDRHDAYSFFEPLGDLVRTGPTFTNVNDFRAVLIV